MTERKRAEAMLLRTQKLNALGQLTGGIAHDFNNLLTVISLNMEIVEDVLEPAHPAWEVLAPIRDAARSGAQLIQSLLAFASRSQLRPVPSDIPVLLRSVALLATRTLGERHQVEIGPSGKPLRALVDPAQFESAILNLLVNSRDAMPQGGVIRITATRVVLPADLPASAAVLAPGAYVNVAVSDAGAGIPQGLVDQVVEPFFTTKPPGSGTGLGLSMVAGFARQSGGAVTIDSVVGQGTTVHLFLPAA
jgi:signal transduction histidine kinase